MKDSLDASALVYLLEHLYEGVDLINKSIKSISDMDAPFGFVHDIDIASRCLFDALTFVRKNCIHVHESNRNS